MNDDIFNDMGEDFDPRDYGIEYDEIAEIYAAADIKEEGKRQARDYALMHYADFERLKVKDSVDAINQYIKSNKLSRDSVIVFLSNMISIFEEYEEFEKCSLCNKIKEGVTYAKT